MRLLAALLVQLIYLKKLKSKFLLKCSILKINIKCLLLLSHFSRVRLCVTP